MLTLLFLTDSFKEKISEAASVCPSLMTKSLNSLSSVSDELLFDNSVADSLTLSSVVYWIFTIFFIFVILSVSLILIISSLNSKFIWSCGTRTEKLLSSLPFVVSLSTRVIIASLGSSWVLTEVVFYSWFYRLLTASILKLIYSILEFVGSTSKTM